MARLPAHRDGAEKNGGELGCVFARENGCPVDEAWRASGGWGGTGTELVMKLLSAV